MSQCDDFVSQAFSLASLIGPTVERLEPPTRKILATPEIYGLRQIVLTGSGDSYFAAAAVAPLARALTGLPVQAMTSMEASRYAGAGPVGAHGALVIAVSYSGEAARLVEAVQRWRARGAITLGVTASPNARLAQSADRWVDTQVAETVPAPGTRTYVASLLALYLLVIRMGEVLMRITMDEANALRRELGAIGPSMTGVGEACAGQLEALAGRWGAARTFDLLGSGPSLASAAYGAAKLVEAAGVHAAAQDAEEFFHLNFFVDQPDQTPTVLYAPSNAAFASRARELVGALGQLGRPSLVITDQAGFGGGLDELVLPPVRETFASVLHAAPAALLAAYSAAQRKVTHYRGHDGPWIGARGANLVRNSPIQLAKD
jgi:glucosamine--fructose-6-phosphate aminotransferase (isomerizing)